MINRIKMRKEKNKMLIKEKFWHSDFKISVLTVFLFLLLTFSTSLISSAGVVTPYWDENPLKLSPGESTTVQLSLQNMVGNENLAFEAKISGGNEIATLVDSSNLYLVDFGNRDVPVKVMISVPKNAVVGNKYDVPVSFHEVSSGEGGMLRLATAFTTKIPVLVVGEQESVLYGQTPKKNNTTWIILGLIILVAVLFIVRGKRRR